MNANGLKRFISGNYHWSDTQLARAHEFIDRLYKNPNAAPPTGLKLAYTGVVRQRFKQLAADASPKPEAKTAGKAPTKPKRGFW